MKLWALFLFVLLPYYSFAVNHHPPKRLIEEYNNCNRTADYTEKQMSEFFQVMDSLYVETYEDNNAKNDVLSLKERSDYKSSILTLLNAKNTYKRTAAYRLLGEIMDNNFTDTLLKRVFVEDTLPSCWIYSSITRLTPKETDIAMEWLVRYEDFGDAIFLGSYLTMDTVSAINTGNKYFQDLRPKAKVLALQTLCLFNPSIRSDSLCRYAIQGWSKELKGYAIAALGMCKKGNYKDILLPYLNTLKLNSTIKDVLQNSPTDEDRVFAKTIKN